MKTVIRVFAIVMTTSCLLRLQASSQCSYVELVAREGEQADGTWSFSNTSSDTWQWGYSTFRCDPNPCGPRCLTGLTISPTSGVVQPGATQTINLSVTADPTRSPGTYEGYLYLAGPGGLSICVNVHLNVMTKGYWIAQQSNSNLDFTALSFISDQTAWAIGQGGGGSSVFKTVDGGLVWTNLHSSNQTPYFLYQYMDDIFFINAQKGWTVGTLSHAGSGGSVYKTVDGGLNWQLKFSYFVPYLSGFHSVHFADENNGWVVGDEGRIYRTVNGGTTWTQQNSGTTANLYCVRFLNQNVGCAVGGDATHGEILRTDNAGQTWSRTSGSGTGPFKSVQFVGSSTVYAGGTNQPLMVSANNGLNWSPTVIGCSPIYNVTSLSMTTSSSGWACIGTGLSKTNDAGKTWGINPPLPTTNQINSVQMVNSNVSWAVGAGGTILKYYIPPVSWLRKRIEARRGDVVSVPLVVSNTGELGFGDLTYGGITIRYQELCNGFSRFGGWLSVEPNQVVVPLGQSRTVTFTIDARDLIDSYYGAYIFYTLNGSIGPYAILEVTVPSILKDNGFDLCGTSWRLTPLNLGHQFQLLDYPVLYRSMKAEISIANSSTQGLQFYQDGIFLSPNRRYTLSFWAMATRNTSIGVTIHKQGVPSNTYGLNNFPFSLATTAQRFQCEFVTPATVDQNAPARFLFWLEPYAQAGVRFYFDHIILEEQMPPALVANSGFETGTTGWSSFSSTSNGLTFATEPNGPSGSYARTHINRTGNNMQFYQAYFPLTAGKRYTLSFDAYSPTSRQVHVGVMKHSSNPAYYYGLNPYVQLSAGWRHYEFPFTAGGFAGTTNDTRLRFYFVYLCQSGDDYYFDNIELKQALPKEGEQEVVALPTSYVLEQNYPNPFNPSTNIRFSLPNDGHVSLKVFDLLGREVKTLVNEQRVAGAYEEVFDASTLASGLYFYRLNANGSVQTKKMILTK